MKYATLTFNKKVCIYFVDKIKRGHMQYQDIMQTNKGFILSNVPKFNIFWHIILKALYNKFYSVKYNRKR